MEFLLGYLPDIFNVVGSVGSVCLGANMITERIDSKQDHKLAQAIVTILNYLSYNFGKNKNADDK